MHEETGVGSGNGMVMGCAIGLIFGPALGIAGPLGMILGALIGLVAGAAVAQRKSG